MWVVLMNNIAYGPFGTPTTMEEGRREALAYAQRNTFPTEPVVVIPLVKANELNEAAHDVEGPPVGRSDRGGVS